MTASYHPADTVLRPEDDYALVTPIGDPEVAETFNTWVYDGDSNTGFNFYPMSTPGRMEIGITVFLPDGRIARAACGNAAEFTDPAHPASQYAAMNCLEPFRRWACSVRDMPVWITDDAANSSRSASDTDPTTTISFDAELTMPAPPWINGALLPESRQTLDERVGGWFSNRLAEGFSPLAFRYDSLVEGRGEIRFEGQVFPFSGQGVKGHVRGVRRLAGMNGHTWAEGYSPDGRRGFGVSMFPREGGGYTHSEGFLFQDGKVYPARVIFVPHAPRDPSRQQFVFELACDELGLVRILAEEMRAFWWNIDQWGSWRTTSDAAMPTIAFGYNGTAAMIMRQGVARFTWEDDGSVGHGILEQSG